MEAEDRSTNSPVSVVADIQDMLCSETMVQAVRRKGWGFRRLRGCTIWQEAFPAGREVGWVSSDRGSWVVVRRTRQYLWNDVCEEHQGKFARRRKSMSRQGICARIVDTQG